MFVGVGVASSSAGMFHLLEHAFFKALLFMGAGAVMHALHEHHELDIQRLGGLKNKLPFTYWTFLIGVMAILGLPPFSGFFSKEDVIGAAFARAEHGDGILWIVWALAVLTAALTAIYMLRLFFLVFHGEPRDRQIHESVQSEDHLPVTMKAAMGVLAVLSFVGGWLSIPDVYNEMEAWLSSTFLRFPVPGPSPAAAPFYWQSLVITLAVTLAGVVIAWRVYYVRSPAPERAGALAPALYRFMANRYYVDELYDVTFVRPTKAALRLIDRWFEIVALDGLIDASARFTRYGALRLRRIQTGYVRNYALGILFGAVLVVGYYVVGGR